MELEQLVKHATRLLFGNADYIADVREGARVDNSVVGSLLSMQFSVPRQYAEQAVRHALDTIDSSAAESIEPDGGGNCKLRRSGRPPLAFQGRLLAQADGWRQNGKEQNRWHSVAIFRTAGGRYVVAISYRTKWEGEYGHDHAVAHNDAASAAGELRDYDPVQFVVGYPPGDAYAAKQERLLTDLRLRYQALVSEVLDADEFVEEAD